jgi:hypothetical protein
MRWRQARSRNRWARGRQGRTPPNHAPEDRLLSRPLRVAKLLQPYCNRASTEQDGIEKRKHENHSKSYKCGEFVDMLGQAGTYLLGLKIRTVWVRVPPPLLPKALQNRQKSRKSKMRVEPL